MPIFPPQLYKTYPAIAGNVRLRCAARSYPVPVAAGLSRWASPEVSYSAAFSLPGIPADRISVIVDKALAEWASICGLKPKRVQSGGNIIPGAGRIDGSSGTLAYSYLPGAPSPMNDQLQQVYDQSEQWTEKWLSDVVKHEFGHALGLDHHDDPASIMYPWSNGQNTGFSQWEIDQMVARYGEAAKPSDPPIVVPPAGELNVSGTLVINGKKYSFTLVGE